MKDQLYPEETNCSAIIIDCIKSRTLMGNERKDNDEFENVHLKTKKKKKEQKTEKLIILQSRKTF